MARVMSAPRRASTSNTSQSGVPQGTPGGATTRRPGTRHVMAGDEVYLWILVIFEAFLIGFFRSTFRRYHGG